MVRISPARACDRHHGGITRPVDLSRDIGAGERKGHVPTETKLERQHRDFDAGSILVVAEKDVAGTQGDIVHRTRCADPEAILVEAAEILDAGGACD